MQVKAANIALQHKPSLVIKSDVKAGPMIIIKRDN